MNPKEHNRSQPIRELEYLAQFFVDHGREDLAKEIFDEVIRLRHRAQDSLEASDANVLNFNSNRPENSQHKS